MTIYVYFGEEEDSNTKFEYHPTHLTYVRSMFKYFDKNREAIKYAAHNNHIDPEYLGHWQDKHGRTFPYTQQEADFLRELYKRGVRGEDYNVLGDEWSECLKNKVKMTALHQKPLA